MKELEYILISDFAKIKIVVDILRDCDSGDNNLVEALHYAIKFRNSLREKVLAMEFKDENI